MKISQVSRANGTTQTHQSSVVKGRGVSLWQVVSDVMVWHHFTIMYMEDVLSALFHSAFLVGHETG